MDLEMDEENPRPQGNKKTKYMAKAQRFTLRSRKEVPAPLPTTRKPAQQTTTNHQDFIHKRETAGKQFTDNKQQGKSVKARGGESVVNGGQTVNRGRRVDPAANESAGKITLTETQLKSMLDVLSDYKQSLRDSTRPINLDTRQQGVSGGNENIANLLQNTGETTHESNMGTAVRPSGIEKLALPSEEYSRHGKSRPRVSPPEPIPTPVYKLDIGAQATTNMGRSGYPGKTTKTKDTTVVRDTRPGQPTVDRDYQQARSKAAASFVTVYSEPAYVPGLGVISDGNKSSPRIVTHIEEGRPSAPVPSLRISDAHVPESVKSGLAPHEEAYMSRMGGRSATLEEMGVGRLPGVGGQRLSQMGGGPGSRRVDGYASEGDITSHRDAQGASSRRTESGKVHLAPLFLTKSEKKRRRWEAEKVETQSYYPWENQLDQKDRPAHPTEFLTRETTPGISEPTPRFNHHAIPPDPLTSLHARGHNEGHTRGQIDTNESRSTHRVTFRDGPKSILKGGGATLSSSAAGPKHTETHQRQPPSSHHSFRESNHSVMSPHSTEPTLQVTDSPRLTLAQKKKLQWDSEKKAEVAEYDPWGRPGAGAPPESVSSPSHTSKQEDYDGPGNRASKMEERRRDGNQGKEGKQRRRGQRRESVDEVDGYQQPGSRPSRDTDPPGMYDIEKLIKMGLPPTHTKHVAAGPKHAETHQRQPPSSHPSFRESNHSVMSPHSNEPILQVTDSPRLTLAQKKKLQWDSEKKAEVAEYDPWGRPGAGAPPESVTSPRDPSHTSKQEDSDGPGHPSKKEERRRDGNQGREGKQWKSGQRDEVDGPSRDTAPLGAYDIEQLIRMGLPPTHTKHVEDGPKHSEIHQRQPPSSHPSFRESNHSVMSPHSTEPILQVTDSPRLTLAQKKKLQWDSEKKAEVAEYDPWGRPGAGAPPESVTSPRDPSHTSKQEDYDGPGHPSKKEERRRDGNQGREGKQWKRGQRDEVDGPSRDTAPLGAYDIEQLIKMGLPLSHTKQPSQGRTARSPPPHPYVQDTPSRGAHQTNEGNMSPRKIDANRQTQGPLEDSVTSKGARRNNPTVRVDELGAKIRLAELESRFLKAEKRLDKLKKAGHNTIQLRAAYADTFKEEDLRLLNESDFGKSHSKLLAMLSPRDTESPAIDLMAVQENESLTKQLIPNGHTANIQTTSRTPRKGYAAKAAAEEFTFDDIVDGTTNDFRSDSPNVATTSRTPRPAKAAVTDVEATYVDGYADDGFTVMAPTPRPQQRKKTLSTRPAENVPSKGKNTLPGKDRRVGKVVSEDKPPRVGGANKAGGLNRAVDVGPVRPPRANPRGGKASVASRETVASRRGGDVSRKVGLTPAPTPKIVPGRKGVDKTTHRRNASRPNSRDTKPGNSQKRQQVRAPSPHQRIRAGHHGSLELADDIGREVTNVGVLPITRTETTLSPSKAMRGGQRVGSGLASDNVSREPTRQVQQRYEYQQGMQPAVYGREMENRMDYDTVILPPPKQETRDRFSANTPTTRQMQLIQELRAMKAGLQQKQTEMQSFLQV